jgi:hypothetical protein
VCSSDLYAEAFYQASSRNAYQPLAAWFIAKEGFNTVEKEVASALKTNDDADVYKTLSAVLDSIGRRFWNGLPVVAGAHQKLHFALIRELCKKNHRMEDILQNYKQFLAKEEGK